MQPESNQDARNSQSERANTCPNCHASMPHEMRFCRLCGHRLGEGVAEYTETVRLPYAKAAQQSNANQQNRTQAPFEMPYWGPIARDARGPAQACSSAGANWNLYKQRRRRKPWFIWPIIGIAIATMAGGSMLPLRRNIGGGRPGAFAPAPRSYAGVNEFDTTDNGVTFDVVTPGSAADRAGLVGGDIITSFDGHAVKTSSEMMDLLKATPIGKTVDVIYIRDGEVKTTKITTVSQQENSRLDALAKSGPRGYMGIDDYDRVQVPNSNIYGVKITVETNNPADIAGLKNGDIITAFDNIPIRTEEELLSRIRRAAPASVVNVTVVRDGQQMVIPVKMGQRT